MGKVGLKSINYLNKIGNSHTLVNILADFLALLMLFGSVTTVQEAVTMAQEAGPSIEGAVTMAEETGPSTEEVVTVGQEAVTTTEEAVTMVQEAGPSIEETVTLGQNVGLVNLCTVIVIR